MTNTEEKKELIGPYEVVRLVGKGGMSEVYEVEVSGLGVRRALKLFACEKKDDEVLRRFLVEGRLLARLDHPRVVRVTDIGRDDRSGRPYFVMDLVRDADGEIKSLADVQPGTVDEETVGRWYDDLREALECIHSEGVIHRDLKLQNVLIGPDGHAVLTDFGISKIFEPAGGGGTIVETVQTIIKIREGRSLVMGSVGYMAPELEMGVDASVQSDWYALGVIVYRLLTGDWCDSRTDLAGVLDGYDPVWKRIIPRLLHSNPSARECLSYALEKKADAEKAESAAEERYLREKARGRDARHLFRYAAAAALMLGGILAWRETGLRSEIARLDARLAVPTFESVFEIPDGAGEESTDSMPSREQFRAAMVDALVLTQGVFADLADETITVRKARSELIVLGRRAKNEDMDMYSGLPAGYTSSDEYAALAILFKEAAKRMK